MIKQLIFIRHAHRDTTERSQDNGLSAKGQRQAKWIKRFASQRFNAQDLQQLGAIFLSSPKLRCVQTLEPIATAFRFSVLANRSLDEQQRQESFAALNDRIHDFLKSWAKEAPPVTFICSHGDWLPLAIFHLLGITVELKKGAWFELNLDGSSAELAWSIPSFKTFYEPE